MCSPGVTARDRVLAELAALGPAPANACRPGGVEAVELLGQVRDLAAFADQVTGELARLAAALDAVDGAAEAGYSSVAGFCGMAAAGHRGGRENWWRRDGRCDGWRRPGWP